MQILHRLTRAVLFDAPDAATLRDAVLAAVAAGANLDGANLDGANLDGEVLTKAPLSLLNLRWPVLITEGYMRIGCQRHTHAEWASFDSEVIKNMDDHAPEFWARWKAPLLALCAAHAAGGEAAQ